MSFVLCYYFVICALSFVFFYGCSNQRLYADNRVMMGTFIEVTSADKQAAGIVFDEFRRIENLLNKYDPDSEVSKLNKTGKITAGEDTFYIIKRSKEFWLLSDGAFDITVAPLVELWGFTDKKYTKPEEKKIKSSLKLVGSDKIILNDLNNMVKFKLSGMKIDLGAIAKGYALDCAVNKLRQAGIKSCLINAGGQIFCLGKKFGKPWRVAIRDPRGKGIKTDLQLIDKSVATSGDYEQYFIKDSIRYPHIINPKTGYPADSGIDSVTVISSSALTADALATAIFVLGKEKGLLLVKQIPDVEVKIIEK